MKEKEERGRSSLQIIVGLADMIKPLLGPMALAVMLGSAGNLAATFITIFGGYGLAFATGLYGGMPFYMIASIMAVFAVSRGLLRYGEQSCNHYIAFKLLARIRHQVFAALRRLAPAKLDSSDKGNLISIITTDIELLEVFYAHTVSPIIIALVTSVFMIIFIGIQHPVAGLLALGAYVVVGVFIPYLNGRRGKRMGQEYRESFGELNTVVLDNLYGLEELLAYGQKEKRMKELADKTEEIEDTGKGLKKEENIQRISTDTAILTFGIFMLILCGYYVMAGEMEFYQGMAAVIAMMSSFGPTAALSALSNNLNHTLACGERVLKLLEEEPVVADVERGAKLEDIKVSCKNVGFCYEKQTKRVLENFNAEFEQGKIHGILGESGCGKSTLLKLMLRFYKTDKGSIDYGHESIDHIQTEELRRGISYVTQETFMFHDTVENNIKVANEQATREEVEEAAKKASIHDFIMSLPKGYDSVLSELGDCISGGEKQRIGIARAFLHKSRLLLLDEPTSNIDSLNEGIILRSLEREKEDRTILLVSHRKSTMGIADTVIQM